MSGSDSFRYKQRTIFHCGPDTITLIPELFAGYGAKRVILISDPGLRNIGVTDKVAKVFTENNAVPDALTLVGVFTDISPDAESESVNAAYQYARSLEADAILAVGGGSVLDSAKMVKMAMWRNVDSVDELMGSPMIVLQWPEVQPMGIPHIAVPTTAGTGAECSAGAMVLNKATNTKHIVSVEFIEADIAVLDAHMTTGLPPLLTAATGMDALTHAVEALAHPNINAFGLSHAITAAGEILSNLPLAVANGNDVQARQNMLVAAAMGITASISDMGPLPIHNFAHVFGALFHVHHGEANAVLLPLVLEELHEFYEPTSDRFRDVFGLQESEPGAIVLAAARRVRALLEEMNHPTDFSHHSIPESELPIIMDAVEHDPMYGLLPLSRDVIERVSRRACAW